jgi:hypothetical protein
MQYKLIKFPHFEFDQNMWKSLFDKWKILFMALRKRGFTAWLKFGITPERMVKSHSLYLKLCRKAQGLTVGDRQTNGQADVYITRSPLNF